MVPISARYDGDLSCAATHGPSRAVVTTDAPRDNEGLGRYFSPTDLVGTALATCILTTMAIVGRRHELDLRGATADVEKHMVQGPRRIGRLPVVVRIPGAFTPDQRKLLEAAGRGCPVHESLHPDIEAEIRFEWSGG
jgi:putative redox protein